MPRALAEAEATQPPGEALRIEAALRRESRRRLGVTMLGRSVAMAAAGVLVLFVAPWPDALWWVGLILLFIAFGGAQYLLGRSRRARHWHVYAFAATDMALLVFALLFPNPFSDGALPPQASLRFGSFLYLLLPIAALSMSLRPRLILWGGACAALFWSLGIAWLAALPGATNSLTDDRDFFEQLVDLGHVDFGVQSQNVVILLLVSALIASASAAARSLLVREMAAARRAANLSRYVPAEAVDALALRDAPFGEARRAEAAVLFTDIAGFTALAERVGPEAALALLREAQGLVARAVFEAGGVLDKFIGDGAMATFGAAPALERDGMDPPAARALAAAFAIHDAAARWNESRLGRGEPPIAFAIGLHAGPVVIGDVGSARRMELAVIGDTVNVAARLEEVSREFDPPLAVSEAAWEAAGRPSGLRRLGARALRGRAELVVVLAP